MVQLHTLLTCRAEAVKHLEPNRSRTHTIILDDIDSVISLANFIGCMVFRGHKQSDFVSDARVRKAQMHVYNFLCTIRGRHLLV